MALITCPECGKEVSERVKNCPHCGYPMSQEADQSQPSAPQQVEVVSVKLDKGKTKKILIVVVLAVALVAVCAAIAIMMGQQKKAAARAEYIENLTLARTTMLSGAASAEKLCNLTKSVWYNTIYEESDSETDPFTKIDGRFNKDFNTSLTLLAYDENTRETIIQIKANQNTVAEIMRSLQNPPEDLSACFETVEAMYDAYSNLASLAISPTGSLKSYSEDFRTYDNDVLRYYDKLETQIPEK